MAKYYLFLLMWCGYYTSANAQDKQTTFTSIELKPTVAYLKYEGRAARMVRLLFHGGKSHTASTAFISFNGLKDSIRINAGGEGLDVFELPLPGGPVQHETQLDVKLAAGGREYTAHCMVAPAPEWKVYLLPHSH